MSPSKHGKQPMSKQENRGRRAASQDTSHVKQSTVIPGKWPDSVKEGVQRLLTEAKVMAAYATDCCGARLDYAQRYGWLSFPVPPGTKKSHRKQSNPDAPRWGATRDPKRIERDHEKWPDAGVGIPAGDNHLVDIEIDTVAGHGVNGAASFKTLEQQHGKLPVTLMFESPSGSVHRIFKYPEGVKIRNSVGLLGPGIDVLGEGGMFIAPPTERPGKGVYRWLNHKPVAEFPQWAIDLLATSEAPGKEHNADDDDDGEPEDPEKIARAVAAIPNDDGVDEQFWESINERDLINNPEEKIANRICRIGIFGTPSACAFTMVATLTKASRSLMPIRGATPTSTMLATPKRNGISITAHQHRRD